MKKIKTKLFFSCYFFINLVDQINRREIFFLLNILPIVNIDN